MGVGLAKEISSVHVEASGLGRGGDARSLGSSRTGRVRKEKRKKPPSDQDGVVQPKAWRDRRF